MTKRLVLVGIVVFGGLHFTACTTASPGINPPRPSSVYDTTGFGTSNQEASAHAVENAKHTCGSLPVEVVKDSIKEVAYPDTSQTLYEINMSYRCHN